MYVVVSEKAKCMPHHPELEGAWATTGLEIELGLEIQLEL